MKPMYSNQELYSHDDIFSIKLNSMQIMRRPQTVGPKSLKIINEFINRHNFKKAFSCRKSEAQIPDNAKKNTKAKSIMNKGYAKNSIQPKIPLIQNDFQHFVKLFTSRAPRQEEDFKPYKMQEEFKSKLVEREFKKIKYSNPKTSKPKEEEHVLKTINLNNKKCEGFGFWETTLQDENMSFLFKKKQ